MKRIASQLALQTEEILRSIISRLPLLERLRARRVAKHWTNVINSFPDLHNVPFYEPQETPREFIIWRSYDTLNNLGPFLTGARWEPEIEALSPAPVIAVHPLLERMDAYVKKHAIPGSVLAAEPTPLKCSFKLRICPEWLIAMRRTYQDRRWREMYITQPPCTAISEMDLEDEDGITLGMLADRCVEMQTRDRTNVRLSAIEEDMPKPLPFKVEFFGVREGSFWVRQARGEIERGCLFVPAVHGF